DVHDIAQRIDVGGQMRAAEIECDQVGTFTDFDAADFVFQSHGARTGRGRHLENGRRLPVFGDRAFLYPSHHQRPAHDLHHVGVHVVGTERQMRARGAQFRSWRDGRARRVAFGDVRDVNAGPADAGDVAL